MRGLHPIGSQERLVRASRYARPDQAVEEGTIHAIAAGRHAVRVSVDGARRTSMWHLVLDQSGAPERLQARLREDGRVVDVTMTFFEDEVLVWRRGGGSPSEAVAIPPGYRLLWPPYTGRGLALAGLPAVDGPDARMFALVRPRPLTEGALEVRPVKLSVRPAPGGLTLQTPGLPDARVEIDSEGEVLRWHSEGTVIERVPTGATVSHAGATGGMMSGSKGGPAAGRGDGPEGPPEGGAIGGSA